MATQREVASHIGSNEHHVRELVRIGVLDKPSGRGGYSLDVVRLTYIRYLKSQIDGDGIDEEKDAAAMNRQKHVDDINKERARQAAETADKLAMENAERRRELVPTTVLRDAMLKTGSLIRARLESLPAHLKRRIPHLRADELATVKQEIAKLSDELAGIDISDEGAT